MTEETKTVDRFDLEQQILDCWQVTNDIKLWALREATSEDLNALSRYYEHKFNLMWDTLKNMIHEGKM